MFSNSVRVFAIFHLCLVFCLLFSRASEPFTGELYRIKAQKQIFEFIINKQANLFYTLPQDRQKKCVFQYQQLLKKGQKPFPLKLIRSFKILFQELCLYERLWIGLSILLPILLLLNREGAGQAIWILPLLTCIWAIDNQRFGTTPYPSKEQRLFPSESYLLANYLLQPLSGTIQEQQKQLSAAWERYLVHEWVEKIHSNEVPVVDSLQLENDCKAQASAGRSPTDLPQLYEQLHFTSSLEKGLFAFNLARTDHLSPIEISFNNPEKLSLYFWGPFLLWQLLFALITALPKSVRYAPIFDI